MVHFPARWLGLFLTLFLCASAQATVLEIVGLDDLVKRSDLIVQGEVTSAEGKLVNGHIETTIHLKVAERWKGTTASDDLALTQMGGMIEEPFPLGQAVPGLPSFAAKEKVILFLSTRQPAVAPALRQKALAANGGQLPALWTSPQVIGGFQGKYNIYEDAKTRKPLVIRQSALASQGTDPDKMPPEVQAKIAASVSMAEAKAKSADPLTKAAAGSVPAPAPNRLTSPAPTTAVSYDKFREEVLKMVGPEESKKALANGAALPPSSVPLAPDAEFKP